jgi:hypothetical protein
MKLSSVKSVFQKFSFFKDYSSLIVPALLAIVAALFFVPMTLMQRSLANRIEKQSVAKEKMIESLRNVPSGKQWTKQREREVSIRNDANNIAQLAEQSSQRQLLSYSVFPAPKEVSRQIFEQFGGQYRTAIGAWASDLRARECPTQEELSKSRNRSADVDTSFESDMPETDRIIIDHLCNQVAQSVNVYFDPANIAGYKFWDGYQYSNMERSVGDCWYWQIGYWIIEDVFQTVKTLNAGSANVLIAPVKRIVEISFSSDSASDTASSAGTFQPFATDDQTGMPQYVTSLREGTMPPLTARVSNDRIDVVHFRLSVVVSAKAVPQFLQQLCSGKTHSFRGFHNELTEEKIFHHNQITILGSDFEAVRPEDGGNKFYRYGSDGVVQLVLRCEYVFDEKGYDAIKPPSVQKDLDSRIQQSASQPQP